MASTTKSSNTKRPRADDNGGSNKKTNSKLKSDDGNPQKASKGLRHFSMKVCKKVEEKGHTTYNEVADELVKEFMAQRASESCTATGPALPNAKKNANGKDQPAYDEKNIRRRVYDALNVLMAMDIISKEKKEITWKGLPNNATHDLEMLQRERAQRMKEVNRKRETLKELLLQQVCFRNLVQRNRQREYAMMGGVDTESISLPFIVVNTSSDAEIVCKSSVDWTDVMLDFSHPFEINDDNEILKRLGLDKISRDELSKMLPPDMMKYCLDHHLLESVLIPDTWCSSQQSHFYQSPFESSALNTNDGNNTFYGDRWNIT